MSEGEREEGGKKVEKRGSRGKSTSNEDGGIVCSGRYGA